jgi:hypothetical protein
MELPRSTMRPTIPTDLAKGRDRTVSEAPIRHWRPAEVGTAASSTACTTKASTGRRGFPAFVWPTAGEALPSRCPYRRDCRRCRAAPIPTSCHLTAPRRSRRIRPGAKAGNALHVSGTDLGTAENVPGLRKRRKGDRTGPAAYAKRSDQGCCFSGHVLDICGKGSDTDSTPITGRHAQVP